MMKIVENIHVSSSIKDKTATFIIKCLSGMKQQTKKTYYFCIGLQAWFCFLFFRKDSPFSIWHMTRYSGGPVIYLVVWFVVRLFFRPDQSGMSKVEAAVCTLRWYSFLVLFCLLAYFAWIIMSKFIKHKKCLLTKTGISWEKNQLKTRLLFVHCFVYKI